MIKQVIVILLMVTFLLPLVMAQEYSVSRITVKSVPNVTVYLKILEPISTNPILYSMELEKTNEYGDVHFMYGTNDSGKMKFDLEVKVKDGKVDVYPSSGTSFFGSYNAGENVFIEAYEDYHNIILTPGTNSNEEENINDTEEAPKIINISKNMTEGNNNSSISWFTGDSIIGAVKEPAVYGGIGGVFILGILSLFILGRRRKNKVISSNNFCGDKKVNLSTQDGKDHELSIAESKLKTIQAEIQKLKNGDKLSEIKKRIATEEEDLRKLRSKRI